jgi:hypothetical protein
MVKSGCFLIKLFTKALPTVLQADRFSGFELTVIYNNFLNFIPLYK